MAHPDDQDRHLFVADLVDDAVIADPNSVERFFSRKLFMTVGSWVLRQIEDGWPYAVLGLVAQLIEFLLRFACYAYLVFHLSSACGGVQQKGYITYITYKVEFLRAELGRTISRSI